MRALAQKGLRVGDLLCVDWGAFFSVVRVSDYWDAQYPDEINVTIVLRTCQASLLVHMDEALLAATEPLTPVNYHWILSELVFPKENVKKLFNNDYDIFKKMHTQLMFDLTLPEYSRRLRADTLAAASTHADFCDVAVYGGKRPDAVIADPTMYAQTNQARPSAPAPSSAPAPVVVRFKPLRVSIPTALPVAGG